MYNQRNFIHSRKSLTSHPITPQTLLKFLQCLTGSPSLQKILQWLDSHKENVYNIRCQKKNLLTILLKEKPAYHQGVLLTTQQLLATSPAAQGPSSTTAPLLKWTYKRSRYSHSTKGNQWKQQLLNRGLSWVDYPSFSGDSKLPSLNMEVSSAGSTSSFFSLKKKFV